MSGGSFAWKDISELHLASLATPEDDLFDQVMGGLIAKARWEIDARQAGRVLDADGEETQTDLMPAYKVGQIKEIRREEGNQEGWFCPLFMRKGEITLLAGESKRSGKTTKYMHMLKCVHDGKPFMGMPTLKSGALVLTEQGSNILEATTKAGIADDDAIYFSFYKDLSKTAWPKTVEQAVEKCLALGVEILVIDTFTAFARLRGSDENLSGEIIERMEPVVEAARVHGLHVSVLHHTGKDGDIRGSSAFTKDPDVVWILKRPPGEHAPNVRAMEGLGRYDSVNTAFNIALEIDGYKLLGSDNKIERQRAESFLLVAIPEGSEAEQHVRRARIFESGKEIGLSERTMGRALQDLIDKGTVKEEADSGKGNPLILWRPKRSSRPPHRQEKIFPAPSPTPPSLENQEGDKTPANPEDDLFPADPHPMHGGSAGNNNENPTMGGSGDGVSSYLFAPLGEYEGALEAYRALQGSMTMKGWAAALQWTQVALRPVSEYLVTRGIVTTEMHKEKIESKTKSTKLFSRAPLPAEHDPRYVYEHNKLVSVVEEVNAFQGRIALDLETSGTNALEDSIRIIALSMKGEAGETVYAVDAGRVDVTDLITALHGKFLIGHNITFDISFIYHRYGVSLVGEHEDTQDLSRIVRAGEWDESLSKAGTLYCETVSHGLEDVLRRELHVGLPVGKRYQKGHNWTPEKVLTVEHVSYATGDVVHLVDLADALYERGREIGLTNTLKLERMARPAFLHLNLSGVPCDTVAWQAAIDEKRTQIESLKEKLDELAPDPPEGKAWMWGGSNPNLPNHPGAALSRAGIKLKDLRESTRLTAFEENPHPLLGTFNEWKKAAGEVSKMAGYIGSHCREGRIYSSTDQTGTESGRSSSHEPNSQNLPREGGWRSLIRPEEGKVFVDGDLSQIELRVLADKTRDPVMRQAFLDERDLHRETAERIVGHPVDPETEEGKRLRNGGKRINFALPYGLSWPALKGILDHYFHVPEKDLDQKTDDVLHMVLTRHHAVASWIRDEKSKAREGDTETRTIIGRRRILKKYPNKDGVLAINPGERLATPIQGSAADIYKLSLAYLFEELRSGDEVRIVLGVHDQITLEVPADEGERYRDLLEETLKRATKVILKDKELAKAGEVAEVEIKSDWSK
jgi:DNA polymerase I-like protein with 3'-5' exonuclease and polymerase domains